MGFRCPIFGFKFEVSLGYLNLAMAGRVEAVLAFFGGMVLAVWF